MLDFPSILALILMESSKQRKQQTCDQQLSYNQINVINPNFIAPLLCNLIGSFDFNFTSVMALVPRVAPGQVDNSGSG